MENPQKIGRYEVIDELGRGAMGSVFRAKDPAMGRTVALKTILPGVLAGEDGKEFRERFYREARAAGALAHPGIVPVFDVGEHEGTPYLVMEYVSGQTLAQSMRQGGLSTLDRVCELGQQMAEALAYAHRNGVVHRDMKPANVLLTSREVYGIERAKITDFGVAKLASSELTTTGKMVGTPTFMPPEQFTGAPIDGRTDIFSVGVILYWMATGEQPFAGETMTSVSYKVVHTDPIPPTKLNPGVSSGLEAVILRCLAKNPAERYQTGDDLAHALSALRHGATALDHAPAMTTAVSDATIASAPSLRAQREAEVAAASAPAVATAPVKPVAATKRRGWLVPAAAGVVIVALAGEIRWLATHRNQPPAAGPTAPSASAQGSVAAPVAAAIPAAVSTTPATSGKPSPGVAMPAATPTSASATTPIAAPTAPVVSRLAAVDFNPKTLDPKQNTRLKFDMSKVPAALRFEVQMDGKRYYKGTAGNKQDFDTLYAPPGVHELRILVGSGAGGATSNIVSADFVAKKRMSLKVELRPAQPGSATALGSATQVVATLKQDRLFF
jgi:serine/threonine protein kinase